MGYGIPGQRRDLDAMTGFMGCSEAFVRRPGPQRAHWAVAREIWESVLVPARGFVDDRSGI